MLNDKRGKNEGRQNTVHLRPRNLRTAVIVEDGGPCKVRQISVGDGRGPPGTVGDGGVWRGLQGRRGDCRERQGMRVTAGYS